MKKTAREILIAKADENKGYFGLGQVTWILEAMEEYKNQPDISECRNCGEQVTLISSGEFCPKCYC